MSQLKSLLLAATILLASNLFSQSCQALWSNSSGSVSGEKLFVDNSFDVTTITLLTPTAAPTSSTFLPGETVSVVFPTEGLHTFTYIATNSSTGCSDTIVSTVQVCLIDPPAVSLSAAPGEFIITDSALDVPGETGSVQFALNGFNNYTITGNSNLSYSSNSTVMTTNTNGPHYFWYHTDNGTGSCYDSILVSFDVNSVTSCQANLLISPMTWVSPGTFYLYDQSSNNSVGTFHCAGSVPSTVVFEPWNGLINATIDIPANGTYPYTYVTYDSISNCTDSISGVITVGNYPPPCTIQAGATVNQLNPNPQYYYFSDNSINSTGSYSGSLSFTPDPGIGSYPTSINNSSNYTLVFNANGVYYYSYTVTDSVCSNTINDSIVVFSFPSGSPCQADIQWTMGPGPGQVTLLDTSTNFTSGTFYCADAIPQSSTILPGVGTVIEFGANATFQYSYVTEDGTTLCTDSILGIIAVSGVPCPPMSPIQWSTTSTPGEIIFEDPTFNGVGYAYVHFLSSANTIIYPSYPITQGNTTTANVSANGTYSYSYKIYNPQVNCVDSIIDSLVITDFTGCQADLSYNQYTSQPGTVYLTDQSTNVDQGEVFCAGATNQNTSISIGNDPWQNSGTLTFTSSGSYPYTYVVHNTTTGCSDTITGVFVVTGLPIPCNIQANITFTPGTNPGEYILTDASTGGAGNSFIHPGGSVPSQNVLPNPSVTVTYPSNGTYFYSYFVNDSSGTCTDSLFGTIVVSSYPLPCSTQAVLTITPGAAAGEYIITDNSIGAVSGTFVSTNISGNVSISAGTSTTVNYGSNGWHNYVYTVVDSTGVCSDSLVGSIYVSGVNCGSFAGAFVTPTGTPGEYLITDNSATGDLSVFKPGDNTWGVPVLPNPSTVYSYSANGTYDYRYVVYDSVSLCSDSVMGTIVVTGVIPPANCLADFTLIQDSVNTGQYYCWNNAVNSTGGTSGLSYLWDFGDGATSTQAYPTHTYSTLGNFTLCLTITDSINGCTSTYCDTVVVVVKATGTTINVLPPGATIGLEEEVFVSNLSLFPNPSDGVFKLRLASKANASIELEIISSTGQVVYKWDEDINEGSNELTINRSDLAKGLYLIKLKNKDSGTIETIRFMKK